MPPKETVRAQETEFHQNTGSVGVSGENLALALLEQSDDCIKMLSLDGRLEYMNCAGLRAMEIDDQNMVLGQHWWDLWPKEAGPMLRDSFNAALSGIPQRFASNCPTARGTPKSWVIDLRPLKSQACPIVSVLCTSRDVTNGKS